MTTGPEHIVNPDDQRSLALLAAIIESSGEAIISSDESGRITTWNPAAEQMFGYSAAEAIGRPVWFMVPEEFDHERQQFRGQVDETGSTQILCTKRRRKDGALIDVEIVASPIRNADGAVLGYSSLLRDISERVKREQRLEELEFRYRTFFENMPGLTYIHSPSVGAVQDLLEYSHQFGVLTGFSAEEWAANRDFAYEVVHPDDLERLQESDRQALHTPGIHEVEYRIITRDGRTVWVRDRAQMVHNAAGQALYWLGLVLDISEQKRAEQATAEALAQLQASNRDLEQLNDAKSDFVSMISHEFRTPLTSIQGFSELIAMEADSLEEARDFANTINLNAVRLSRLIGDVLDLDRMEAGRTEFRLELTDLHSLIAGVVKSLRPTTTRHRFETHFDPAMPEIWCDRDLIVRVVTNLVANAIKYSPAGGVITLSTVVQPQTVAIQIGDEGLGIPPEYRERVFSRFGRIARPEQMGIEGTGLGLPIARHIVEQHGGEIWIEDNEPHGTVFHVVLPIDGGR